MKDDEKSVAERALERLNAAAARPPGPLPLEWVHRTGTTTGVMHWIHTQDVNAFALTDMEPFAYPAPGMLATGAREMDDPLLGLAKDLERMANECRRHGVVPIGINLSTEHGEDPGSFTRMRGVRRAIVSIDVTVIPREWIVKTINEAKQADNPTEESSEH